MIKTFLWNLLDAAATIAIGFFVLFIGACLIEWCWWLMPIYIIVLIAAGLTLAEYD